jgi:hypothetical protein
MFYKVIVESDLRPFYEGDNEERAMITYHHMCNCSNNKKSAFYGKIVKLYTNDFCVEEYSPFEEVYNESHTD